MDKDQNISAKPAVTHDFEQLTQDLKSAVARFQDDQTPENFAGIVTALTGFGLTGADLWKKVADYAKVHPVPVALGAGVLFYAIKGLMRESARREGRYH